MDSHELRLGYANRYYFMCKILFNLLHVFGCYCKMSRGLTLSGHCTFLFAPMSNDNKQRKENNAHL